MRIFRHWMEAALIFFLYDHGKSKQFVVIYFALTIHEDIVFRLMSHKNSRDINR